MDHQVLFVLGSRTCVPEDPLLAARRLGLRSVVFTPRPPGCEIDSGLIDHIDYVDASDPKHAVELARRLNTESAVDGVIGYEEDATLVAAHIAAELGLPAHPVHAAEAAMDKPTMKQQFIDAGVPCADFIVAADEDDAVAWADGAGYPVIVKPCRGGASQGVIRANDASELREAYRRLRRIIRDYSLDNGIRPSSAQLVERYLSGNEVSCELLFQHGHAEVVTEFGKPLPLTGPFFEETIYVTPPTLAPGLQQEIRDLAVAAAKSLGFYHGPAHCEIRITPDGPKVLEIAGRVLGGACARSFRDRLGGDIHTFLLQGALGQRVSLPAPPEHAPVVGALMLPVPGEGRVVGVRGAERARRVPGVWDVTLMAAPGDVIVPFPEQACYAVGFVSASGRDETEVVDSLTWAASSISLELAPLPRDRWSRPVTPEDIGEHHATRATALSEIPSDTAQTHAAQELAHILFDELPDLQGTAAAETMVSEWLGTPGSKHWLKVNGLGAVLAGIDGSVGRIGPGGALPEARNSASSEYTHLIRRLIDEFARRGLSECVVDVDPRLTAQTAVFSELGFTRQPSAEPPNTWLASCAITQTPQSPATERMEEGANASQQCCAC